MELLFDHGTLVLRGCARDDLPPGLHAFVWDERIAAWRAPAHHYARILGLLRAGGHRGHDRVPCRRAERVCITAPSLRDYQAAAVDSWELADRRGLIVLPTGSGKTRVAVAAMARCGVATLVLVPTRALLAQWAERIAESYDGDVGIVGDGRHDVQALTACTFESGLRHADTFGGRFGLVVVDEAHHFASGIRAEALEMCTAPARLGLTATPPATAEGRARLLDLIGPVTCERRAGEMLGTHLAPLERTLQRIALDPDERRRYDAAQEPFDLARRTFFRGRPEATWSEFLRALVQAEHGREILAGHREARRIVSKASAKMAATERLVARHAAERVLVFTSDNEAAYDLSRRLLVPAVTCDIKAPERVSILQRFRDGGVRVLVSARVMNEGFDVPEAAVAVVLGGRLGAREHVQRVGRILRRSPGKTALLHEVVAVDTFEDLDAARRGRALAAHAAP